MEIAKLFASLGLRPDEKSFARGNKLIGGIKTALAAFAGVELVRGVASAVNATVELGGHLDDLRQKTGLTAEALQEWGAIAARGGSSMDGFADGVKHFSKTLAEAKSGSTEAKAALTKLGLSSDDVNAAMAGGAGLDAALMKVSDTIAKMPDGPAKTAAAMAAMGRAGDALIPAFNGGSEAIAKMRTELKDFELTGAQVSALDDLGDKADEAKGQLIGLKNQAIAQLAPVLKEAVQGLMEWVKANRALIQSGIQAVVKGLITGFRVLGAVVKATAETFTFLSDAGLDLVDVLEVVAIAWGAVQLAMLGVGGPVIAVLAAIAIGVTEIVKHWDKVKAAIKSVATWMKEKLLSAAHAIERAFGNIWDGIKSGFEAIGNLPIIAQLRELVSAIGDMIDGSQTVTDANGKSVKLSRQQANDAFFDDAYTDENGKRVAIPKTKDNGWTVTRPAEPGRYGPAPSISGARAISVRAPGGGPRTINMTNKIEITSNTTDPAQVTREVTKMVKSFWDGKVREAHAGAGGDE